jgi:hypothetical protein
MKGIYTAIIIVFVFIDISIGQTITGIVTDANKYPIPFTSVVLMNIEESTILSYSTTDDKGCYIVKLQKKGEFLLRISNFMYQNQEKNISIYSNEIITANFILEETPVHLNEIIVKGRYTGISYGKDTIFYNPKIFTDGSEVVLGDVLNKLPGIEVDVGGNIKAHGKDVDKLLLNGQDFFAGNTQMATKNLSADIAESIEVLNNYSEYSMLNGFQSHEQTAINIGVNKNKLGKISGNISIGGGYENKYNINSNLLCINSKTMIALLAAKNNTGEEVFSINDYFRLQGGINEVMGNNGSFEMSEEEQRLLMPSNNIYAKTNAFSALNLSYQPKQKIKLNSYILFNTSQSDSEDSNLYTYNSLNRESYKLQEKSSSIVDNKLFSGYFKINYNPSSTFSFIYNGSISNSIMENNEAINSISKNQQLYNYGIREINPLITQHKAMLMKTLKKHIFLSSVKLNYSDRPNDYYLKTDSLLLPLSLVEYDNWYYGKQNIKQDRLNGELTSAFLFRLNKDYYLKPTLGVNFEKQSYTSFISENNPFEENKYMGDTLHNELQFKLYDYYGSLEVVKNRGLFQFKMGTSAHIINFSKNITKQINYDKIRLNPVIELSLVFSEKHKFNTSFSKTINMNSIKSFSDKIIFDSYQSYFFDGSLNYLYETQYNIGLRYNLYDMFSNTMIIFTGNYNKGTHSISKNYLQEGILSSVNSMTSPNKEDFFSNLYLKKSVGFIPWTINYTGSYIHSRFYNWLSGQLNRINTQIITNQFKMESKYQLPINIESYLKIEYLKNIISFGYKTNQSVQRYGCILKFKNKERFYSDIGFEYVKNDMIYMQDQFILSGNIRYLTKNNIEFQLRGNNVLNLHNQNWSSISYKENYNLEQFYKQIPGNIICSVKYIFK